MVRKKCKVRWEGECHHPLNLTGTATATPPALAHPLQMRRKEWKPIFIKKFLKNIYFIARLEGLNFCFFYMDYQNKIIETTTPLHKFEQNIWVGHSHCSK